MNVNAGRGAADKTGTEETVQNSASRKGVFSFLRTVPFTIVFVVIFLALGAATGAMFSSAEQKPWFESVATGLPALQEGRWWTVFTSPFVLAPPYTYATTLPLIVIGFGWAERCFGTLRTIIIALGGHIVGILGAAGVVALIAPADWHWADMLAGSLDVGPSCGAFAALVFAIGTLPSPWRLRARVAIVLWVGISLLYLGHLYDVEHAVAMIAALTASGFIRGFRRPAGRARGNGDSSGSGGSWPSASRRSSTCSCHTTARLDSTKPQ